MAAGLLVGGIAGALLAVPLLAVLNSGLRSLRSRTDGLVDPADTKAEDSGPADGGERVEPP